MLSYSLTSLLVFYEVVKSKGFSRAAEALSMTQPGVSNHVAQLEVQIGKALLNREKGVLELTKEGKTVFRYAEKILKVAKELESTINGMQKDIRPLLRIGTTRTYAKVMMPQILGSFQKTYPKIMIKLDMGGSEDMEKTLSSLQNDIVIIANPRKSKKLWSFPFVKEELFLITSTTHALASRESVSLLEIKDYPLIIREEGSASRRIVLSSMKDLGVNPAVLIEAKSTEFIKEWVAQGKGIGVVSRRSISAEDNGHLKAIPFKNPLFLEIFVVSLKSRKYDIWIHRFIDLMKTLDPLYCAR
jgi:DNA-binding transcriptional LysR family regulator